MDIGEALNKMKPPVMFLDDDRERELRLCSLVYLIYRLGHHALVAALACAEWGTEFDDIEDEVETQVTGILCSLLANPHRPFSHIFTSTEKQKHDKNVAGDFSLDPG